MIWYLWRDVLFRSTTRASIGQSEQHLVGKAFPFPSIDIVSQPDVPASMMVMIDDTAESHRTDDLDVTLDKSPWLNTEGGALEEHDISSHPVMMDEGDTTGLDDMITKDEHSTKAVVTSPERCVHLRGGICRSMVMELEECLFRRESPQWRGGGMKTTKMTRTYMCGDVM